MDRSFSLRFRSALLPAGLFLASHLSAQDEVPPAVEQGPPAAVQDPEPVMEELPATIVESAPSVLRRAPAPAAAPVAPVAPAAPQDLPALVIDDHLNQASYGDRRASAALFGTTPLIETPFSVAVYDEALIEDQRAFSTAEVLRNDPSVSLPRGAGFYNRQDFAIRGFLADGFSTYWVDGLPMVQMVEASIDDKSGVSVLKGPAGLRFGAMPPGGAVNYERKRPTPEASVSIQTDVDTFGQFYSQIDLSDTVAGGTFGYRFVMAGDDYDSYYDHAGGDRAFGSALIEWKPNENVTFWASVSGQNRERKGYGGILVSGSGRPLDTGVRTNTMQPWGHNRQEVVDVAAGATLRLDDQWSLHTVSAFGHSVRSGYQSWPGRVFDNGDFEDYEWLIGVQSWESWSHHTHLEGEFETGPFRHKTVLGASFRTYDASVPSYRSSNFIGLNNVYHLREISPVGRNPLDTSVIYQYHESGFFATDTVHFNDWLSALVGLRYVRIHTDDIAAGVTTNAYDNSTLSPTAALMVEPIDGLHTYVSFTQGMQQGGVAPSMAVNALEIMDPIASRQIEIGTKAELLEGRLYGEMAFFQIEQDLEYLDNTNRYVQDGLQVHEGFELALRGRLSDDVQAGVSAMFLDAVQQETGNPTIDGRAPDNLPDRQATAWLDWEVPQVPGLGFRLSAYSVAERFADSQEQFTMDDYVVLNAGVRYRFSANDADWTLRLNVENVTDERYFTHGTFLPGYSGQLEYGSPVAARLSVQVDF